MNIVEGDTNTHPSFLQNFNFYKFTFPTFLGDTHNIRILPNLKFLKSILLNGIPIIVDRNKNS